MEKELEELQVKLDKALAEIESLTTEKETLSTAKAELEAQVSSKDEVISTYQKKELVADRTAKIAATGLKMETDPEKLAKKQDFWTGLSEEAFAEYIEDITLASKQPEKPKTGLASLRSVELPRPAGNGTDAAPSLADIKNRFRTLSRVPSEE